MTRSSRLRILVAATLACGALAVPAAAQAATVVVPPCSPLIPGEATVPVQGSGFAPSSLVTLAVDGQTVGTVQTDETGAFAQAVTAPSIAQRTRNVQTFQLTATDQAGTAAATPLQITRVTAALPERARPRSLVRYRIFGFPVSRGTVYVHIRRGGRTLGSFRIGTPQAPCGTTSRRLRYMPLRSYRPGVYDYVFQASRRYSADEPGLRLRIQIVRRIVG